MPARIFRASPVALMPVLMKYCDKAIAQLAATKYCQPLKRSSDRGPKKNLTMTTVRNVEHAIIAELNATTSGFLLILTPEINPSAAARKFPANPPRMNRERNMKG